MTQQNRKLILVPNLRIYKISSMLCSYRLADWISLTFLLQFSLTGRWKLRMIAQWWRFRASVCAHIESPVVGTVWIHYHPFSPFWHSVIVSLLGESVHSTFFNSFYTCVSEAPKSLPDHRQGVVRCLESKPVHNVQNVAAFANTEKRQMLSLR